MSQCSSGDIGSHLQYVRCCYMVIRHTRKKELIDRLYHLGLSISYDHVLCLSAKMGNRVCKQFHIIIMYCVLQDYVKVSLLLLLLITYYNPSSTISKDLVWYRYMENTLKSTATTKHGKGMYRDDDSGTLIPGNWQKFLRVDSNKTDPF